MDKLILAGNELFKDCGFPYYICGGFALELFLGKKMRPHSDLDISVFEENRQDVVELLLADGWSVYHRAKYQTQIFTGDDPLVQDVRVIWAIKLGSPLIVKPLEGEENLYDFEILKSQTEFNFIEIVIDTKDEHNFLLGKQLGGDKFISRALDKAILSKDGIPYMAPEVVLFLKSHPVYLTHEFHKEKTPGDFAAIIPALPDESRQWLVKALEVAYPEGNSWTHELKK